MAMPELQWLEKYTGQTVDELIALEGKYRTDSLVLAFEQAIDQKVAHGDAEDVSEEEMIVLAIEAMEREVNNGGWGQFFIDTGQFAPIIVDALRRIGCPKTATIARRAVKIVEETPITDEEIENLTWEENETRQEALDVCDNQYFEAPEKIEESLFAFIKANRAKFRL
jgi:Domain of unknown function (DUF4375)